MGTQIYPLVPEARRRVGDDLENHPQIYTDAYFLDAFEYSVDDYNERNKSTVLEVTGSGTSLAYTTTVDAQRRNLLVLYCARNIFKQERARAQRKALLVTDPAGRTDATELHKAANFQVVEIEREIARIWGRIDQSVIEDEMTYIADYPSDDT